MNWNQLQTILWLRWRLTRNQWARSGGLGAVVAVIVAGGSLVLGGLTFLGGLLGGALGLGEASPQVMLAVWFGVTVAFIFLWMIGLLTELQRSETIDLQRLMHLPVALGQMFVVNYLVSHLAFSVVLAVPAMLGLAFGLTFARGVAMLLLVPLALAMVLMVTAWTYCLRGWLATLMSNPRRRRTIVMGITLAFILLGQGPNLYFNVIHRADRSRSKAATRAETQRQRAARKASEREIQAKLLAAQKFIPPLWLPVGAQALAEGRALPALFGALGCFAIGALGLRRAYRSTVRFYHGETGEKRKAHVKTTRAPSLGATATKTGPRFLELHLAGVPEQATALALASFRSMLRAPEVKMAWATSFIAALFLGAMIFARRAPNLPEAWKPFAATGAAALSIFLLMQFLANQFGFDRDGFRALVLSPADRRLILLGRNLATLPVGAAFGALLLILTSVWLSLPPLLVAAGFFQLATTLVLASLGGNVLSILVPYRIAPGSMKPTKMPAAAMLVMVGCQMLFPLAVAPVFVAPLGELLWRMAGGSSAVPVNLMLSGTMAALTVFGYYQLLGPMGRLLQRREVKILEVVTVETE
ncbi:MAG: hypothetical protein L0Z50_38460 [Verrucomicrobiales bacterium]|nr:hypothetical protein [Verrucomicrobiales bacterium]